MSKKLLQVLKEFVMEEAGGRQKLAKALGLHERSIYRFLIGETEPKPHQAYILAVTAGCTEKQAKQLVGGP